MRNREFLIYSKQTPSILHIFTAEFYFFLFEILFLEAVFRVAFTRNLNEGVLFTLLFSINIAFLFSILTNLFRKRLRKIVFYFIASLLTLITIGQIIYTTIFGTMLVVSSLSLTGIAQGAGFISSAIEAISQCWLKLLITLIPIIVSILLRRSFFNSIIKPKYLLRRFLLVLLLHIICLASLFIGGTATNSAYDVYNKNFSMNICAEKVGLFTTERLDLKFTIFGKPDILIEAEGEGDNQDPTEID